jgi:endonuclease/exonuclease/phosphatase family metal-dependent hydrolase
MQDVLTGNFADFHLDFAPPRRIRVVDWNIDRGLKLPGIIEFLASQKPDLILLQEVDLNTRRTGRLDIAEELARKLHLYYAFGCEFQELLEGSRRSPAYTGQATLCRWPLRNCRVIRFRAQSTFWRPRWYLPKINPFQERLGGRIALVTETRIAGHSIVAFNLHLESRGEHSLRAAQLKEVLLEAGRIPVGIPALIAGDLNFDPFNEDAKLLIQRAGFCDGLGMRGTPTTTRRGLFNPGKWIDTILVKGFVHAQDGRVHSRVRVSDHYPVSCTLTFPS